MSLSISNNNNPHTEDSAVRDTSSKDSVRSASVDEIVTQKELTTYVEDEHLLEAIQPGTREQNLHLLNSPFPSQQLGTVLGRSYEIETITWGSASTGRLATYDFPGDLFAKPQISQLLDYYKFFRCRAVRIGLRINSTTWHYGTLIISQMPHVLAGAGLFDPQTTVEAARNNKPFLLSAMTAGVIEVDFEWQIPVDWINIDASSRTGSRVAEMTKIFVDVLVPLKQVGQAVAQSVDVTIFASFIEPELSGMNPDELIPQSKSTKVNSSETKKKTEQHSLLADASDWISGAVDMLGGLGDAVTKLAPLAALLDKPTTLDVVTKTRLDMGNELSQGAGADPSNKLSLLPTANISSGGHFMGPMDPCAPLLECLMRPGWLRSFSFTSDTAAGTLIDSWPVDPALVPTSGASPTLTLYPHYLGWFTSQFVYWRGGMRYLFYFTASCMTSCRIRITFFPGSSRAFAVGDHSGDVISRVIDISGDTHTAVDVPYIADRAYRYVKVLSASSSLNNSTGYIGVELINRVALSDPTQSATVTCNVWVAAGPDFQVNQLDGCPLNNIDYNWEYVLDEQSHVGELMDLATPIIQFDRGVESRLVAPEEYRCVTDLLKRYNELDSSNYSLGASSSTITAQPSIYSTNLSSWAWLLIPFRWRRGGMRFRVYTTNTAAPRRITWTRASYALHYSKGALVNYGPNGLVLAVEAPYYQDLPYLENNTRYEYYANYTLTMNLGSTEIVGDILVSVADDFGIGGLWSPPALLQSALALPALKKGKTEVKLTKL